MKAATLEKAIAIALEAHAGQVDKAGQPYILHPLRCMMATQTEAQRVAAVLHDVVEDTDWTLEALAAEGFPPKVIDTVDRLSRRQGETYDAFISRVMGSEDAVAVKIADIEDNLDVLRLLVVTEKDGARLNKYLIAWRKLKGLSA